jgi:hypothetical protein
MNATERELLAVLFAVRYFKHYLLGAPRFDIRTDHKRLECLHKLTSANVRLVKLLLEIEAHNYDIQE